MKKISAIAFSIIMVIGLCACGSSSSSAYKESADMDYNGAYAGAAAPESFAMQDEYAEDYEAPEEAEYDEADDADDAAVEENSKASGKGESVASNRKLIKRVNLTAETQEFDRLTAHIEKKVESLGGYMENSNVYSGSAYSGSRARNATYTARVPIDRLSELVADVGENANIVSKSESAEDITLKYVDSKSRKEALQVEYDRLMEILKQAEDVDTIVALESRITDVRYEIQNIESQLRTYDNLVDFATVNISVSEVEVYTPEPVKNKTKWEEMSEGFIYSLKSVGEGIVDFFIGLVIALPYLVVWAVVITVIVLIIKAVIRSIKKKAQKKKEAGTGRAMKKRETDNPAKASVNTDGQTAANADKPATGNAGAFAQTPDDKAEK